MTGAALIIAMQQVLARFFEVAAREQPALYGNDHALGRQQRERLAAWQHHQIVAAIRDRDVGEALAIMCLHFQVFLAPGRGKAER
jgi:DNA-binding GntR family transcriptional regulator